MDDDGYVLYFIDLPDERVCLKVPRIPPSMLYSRFDYCPGYQYTCDVAKGYPVNMTLRSGLLGQSRARGRGRKWQSGLAALMLRALALVDATAVDPVLDLTVGTLDPVLPSESVRTP